MANLYNTGEVVFRIVNEFFIRQMWLRRFLSSVRIFRPTMSITFYCSNIEGDKGQFARGKKGSLYSGEGPTPIE